MSFSLNPPQVEAVETLSGPILVLAGAGTGKTRVLTARIAALLEKGGCRPYEILAVTFTNKAAQEMRQRVATLVSAGAEGVWLGTFHAIASKILRRHAEVLGFSSDFSILDMDDQLRLMKQILQAEGIDDKRNPPRSYVNHISRLKDQGITSAHMTPMLERQSPCVRLIRVYGLYQERLQALNALDFGDLLLKCLELFSREPEILLGFQRQFKHLLVDEYQDTNAAQYLWLRALAGQAESICCVGDDDQSIYGWRGADVTNILRFEADFPGAKVIRLEQNYRSTPHILAAASGLIAKNTGRLGKTLWTEVAEGERVYVRGLYDGGEEAHWVADQAEKLRAKGEALDQVSILVRAGFQTREFEERFLKIGLPYRVIGGLRFYERQEIRDAVAYLRLVNSFQDSLAFERICNLPRRGIGPTALKTLHDIGREQGVPLFRAAEQALREDGIKGPARRGLEGFLQQLMHWKVLLSSRSPADLMAQIIEESGYLGMWKSDKSADSASRIENLKELLRALEEFPTVSGFLEHVSLVTDVSQGDPQDQITLMTLHSAKGLEFETVFLAGWEEGLFPHARALEEKADEGLEEERRLAYVGLTRARKRAVITWASRRQVFHQWQSCRPSRFLNELPESHILEGGLRRQVPSVYKPDEKGREQPYMSSVPRAIAQAFSPGQRVKHQFFGEGTIVELRAERVEVDFDDVGPKKVVTSYLTRCG